MYTVTVNSAVYCVFRLFRILCVYVLTDAQVQTMQGRIIV